MSCSRTHVEARCSSVLTLHHRGSLRPSLLSRSNIPTKNSDNNGAKSEKRSRCLCLFFCAKLLLLSECKNDSQLQSTSVNDLYNVYIYICVCILINGNKLSLNHVKSSALLQKLCPFDLSLRRFSAIAFVLPKALLKRLEFNVDLAGPY